MTSETNGTPTHRPPTTVLIVPIIPAILHPPPPKHTRPAMHMETSATPHIQCTLHAPDQVRSSSSQCQRSHSVHKNNIRFLSN
ncbi:hypothetical protein QCA50_001465 [Cerrena zonata]|uniref:Uncharacterized protein n=1 Tax=Cerrena zonata TaxID=2478898 RepID=A0AAW0GXA3_9APHY